MADTLTEDFLSTAPGAASGAGEDDPLVREFMGHPPVNPKAGPPGPPAAAAAALDSGWDFGGMVKALPGAALETVKSLPSRGLGYLSGVTQLATMPVRAGMEQVASWEGLRPEGPRSTLSDFYRAFGVAPEQVQGAGTMTAGSALGEVAGVTEGTYAPDEATIGRMVMNAIPGGILVPQNIKDAVTRGAAQLVGGILEDPTALAGILSGKALLTPGIERVNSLIQTGIGLAALPGMGVEMVDAFGKAKDAFAEGAYSRAFQHVLEGAGMLGLGGLIVHGLREGKAARERSGAEPPAAPVPPEAPLASLTKGDEIAAELPAAQAPAPTSIHDLAREVVEAPAAPEAAATLEAFRAKLAELPTDSPVRDLPEIRAATEKALLAPAPAAGAAEARAADRRVTNEPVPVDRRIAERRAAAAAELGLPEEHPAISRLAEAEVAAKTDPLTGLGNKAHWEGLLQTVDPEADHVLVMDLKKFKPINDQYGHEAGDTVLRGVAQVLQSHLGEDLARFGGDEFGGILRGADPTKAADLAAAVQRDLAATTFHLTMPDGQGVALQGIEAHIGVGRDARAADLAANAAAAESRRGGRGDVPLGEPGPEPAGAAAGGPPPAPELGADAGVAGRALAGGEDRLGGVPEPAGPPAAPEPATPVAAGAAPPPDLDTIRARPSGPDPTPAPAEMQAANEAAASRARTQAPATAPPTAGNLAMKLAPEEVPPSRVPGEPPAAPSPYDPEGLTTPMLKLSLHKEVLDIAGEAMADAGIPWDKHAFPVLSDQIMAMVHDGRLPFTQLYEKLQAHGMTVTEFMDTLWRGGGRQAAQYMNMMMQFAKKLKQVEGGGAAASALEEGLANLGSQLDGMALARGWWRRLDNIRRGLLVTQISTMMRNVETQVARVGVGVLTESLDYALQRSLKAAGFKVEVTARPLDALYILGESVRSLATFGKGEGARRVQGLSDALLGHYVKDAAGKEVFVKGIFEQGYHDRLFNVFASDLGRLSADGGVVLKGADRAFSKLEHAVDMLNILNRGQEFIFRNAVLITRLDGELGAKGLGTLADGIEAHNALVREFEARDPNYRYKKPLADAFLADPRNLFSKLDGKTLDRAIDSALSMTFAETPKSGTVAAEMIRAVNRIPGLTLTLPFPRFMWNTMKFLWDYNPTGFLKLLSSEERAKIAKGDVTTLSKAGLGCAMLFTAYQIRKSDSAGERWYEIKVPGDTAGRTIDIRPFNPFAAHFFVADLLLRWKENRLYQLNTQDVLTGFLSTNLRAGTGLTLIDSFLKSATTLGGADAVASGIKQFAGEYLSGFMTPLQVLADAYAQFAGAFDPSVKVVRDRRISPFLGAVASKLPGGQALLPPLELPTRGGPAVNEFPLVKQLTGLLISDPKNPLEMELQRLDFAPGEVYRGTRDPAFDATTKHWMGIFADDTGSATVLSKEYQALTDPEKGMVLAEILGAARKAGRAMAVAEHPETAMKMRKMGQRQRIFMDALQEQQDQEVAGERAGGPPAAPGTEEEE